MRKSLVKPMSLAMSLLSVLPLAGQATSVLAEDKEPLSFDTNVTNEGEAIEGGTLKVASVSDTALPGVFNNMYYLSNPDARVINYFAEPLYGYDENFTIDDSGFAQVEFNQEDKSVKITIPEGVKWHDGEDVTIELRVGQQEDQFQTISSHFQWLHHKKTPDYLQHKFLDGIESEYLVIHQS